MNEKKLNMKVLVTGAAGFIGSYMVEALLKEEYEVVGLDSINSYYDKHLKYARLEESGINHDEIKKNQFTTSQLYPKYRFIRLDLTDKTDIKELFQNEKFDIVVNLAAQAGVRYSLENPYAYVKSNVLGFLNILESCRYNGIKHLLYASSSSVYGMNNHTPYMETDLTDMPISIYAATKKTDELMAYSYSKLYGVPTTGLRFFTVYGPWGRPDMAPFLFLKSILEGTPIKVFNHGELSRDFTYIDDIVKGVMQMVARPSIEEIPYRIYNIGNSTPVNLMDFISVIEKVTGKTAIKEMKEMQPGDVYCTYADTTHLKQDFGYTPSVPIQVGIQKFHEWYMKYYYKNSVPIK